MGFNEMLVVLIVFTAPAIPFLVIGMVYYYKKKLEHKQILTAMEKGVPISELSLRAPKEKKSDGPGWVRDQSKGITLLIIGIGIAIAFGLLLIGAKDDTKHIFWILWIVPIVFLGNGVGLLIRSSQRRRYEKEEPAEEEAEQITTEDTL